MHEGYPGTYCEGGWGGHGEGCCGWPHHGPHSHHGWGAGYGAGRCGERPMGPWFERRFRTKAERVARLEEYLKDLEAEAQAVRELIQKMRGGQPGA